MNKWLRLTLIIFFSATFFLSAYMLGSYYFESNKQQVQFDELAEMVRQATPTTPDGTPIAQPEPEGQSGSSQSLQASQPLPQYVEVAKLNTHMAGWLCIEGTRINYPVMQTPDSSDYYLKRDFYKNYSGHGCLYAREQCDLSAPSDNITIYGHNMKDGSMFADLMKYRNKSYWQQHRYVTFDTLTQHHTYEVFAVFTTTATKGKGFQYHQFVDAKSEEEFNEFVKDCQDISLYDTGITPQYGDKFITLSTCEYTQTNGRFVVVARRIS